MLYIRYKLKNMKNMKNMKKLLINFLFTFSVVGFVSYLLIIISSYLGCCVGIDSLIYHRIVLGIVTLGTVILGVCLYNNCYKILKPKKL